jgi:hypothetical protein
LREINLQNYQNQNFIDQTLEKILDLDMKEIVKKMLSLNPNDRPTIDQVVLAFDEIR